MNYWNFESMFYIYIDNIGSGSNGMINFLQGSLIGSGLWKPYFLTLFETLIVWASLPNCVKQAQCKNILMFFSISPSKQEYFLRNYLSMVLRRISKPKWRWITLLFSKRLLNSRIILKLCPMSNPNAQNFIHTHVQMRCSLGSLLHPLRSTSW